MVLEWPIVPTDLTRVTEDLPKRRCACDLLTLGSTGEADADVVLIREERRCLDECCRSLCGSHDVLKRVPVEHWQLAKTAHGIAGGANRSCTS